MLISGHIVVRKSKWSYDFLNRPFFGMPGTHEYRGLDRLEWFDFDEAHWDYCLDEDMEKIYKNLHDTDWGGWCPLPQDINIAKLVCNYSNVFAKKKYADFIADNCINEIIAIYSPFLHENIPETTIEVNEGYSFLGYDAKVIGEWSLILYGLFDALFAGNQENKALHIAKWYPKLNKNGLFETLEDAKAYAVDYDKDAENNDIEETARP